MASQIDALSLDAQSHRLALKRQDEAEVQLTACNERLRIE
jgi:hypothetical protein